MWVERIYTPGLAVNTYLVGDTLSGETVVIDPTRDIAPILSMAKEKKAKIDGIIETHVHADFTSGAKELKESLGGQPLIYCSAMGGEEWVPSYADAKVYDSDSIALGRSSLVAIHTPGHTPEHLCWIAFDGKNAEKQPWGLFTGDALFVGSIGRPDLLGSEYLDTLLKESYKTVFERLAKLPDFLEVLPGHGLGSACGKGIRSRSSSTLGYERCSNPFFMPRPFDEWRKELLKEMPPAPPYYQHQKRRNTQDIPLLKTLAAPNEIEIKDLAPDDQLVDIRLPLNFSEGYLSNSLNVPISLHFLSWIGLFVDIQKPLVLIGSLQEQIQNAVERLRLIGFDLIQGYLILSDSATLPNRSQQTMIDTYELFQRLKDPECIQVIDVRSEEEWLSGHIQSSENIPLSVLDKKLDKISKEKPVALICASGVRSSTAASLLRKHGFKEVINIKGGMQAWKEAALPIVNQI